jgi:hypothetical protein
LSSKMTKSTQNALNSPLRGCVSDVQVDSLVDASLIAPYNVLITDCDVLVPAHIVLITADARNTASAGVDVAIITEHWEW